jgi:hypothetical protein
MSSETFNQALATDQQPMLLHQLRELIQSARRRALRAADAIQVRTCWEIGRHIVEFEQIGQDRAEYGSRLIARLAETLTAKFSQGFDASNLRYMRFFCQAFPKCDALRHELRWIHYWAMLRVESVAALQWYMNETATQNWSTRALERQIDPLYYERLLASQDRDPVRQEAATQIAALPQTPRVSVRDPKDNPTEGIILCASKDHSDERYSVLHENEQRFASKYKLVLPTEEELRAEHEREQQRLLEQKGIGNQSGF